VGINPFFGVAFFFYRDIQLHFLKSEKQKINHEIRKSSPSLKIPVGLTGVQGEDSTTPKSRPSSRSKTAPGTSKSERQRTHSLGKRKKNKM